jgi:hypothetical protein
MGCHILRYGITHGVSYMKTVDLPDLVHWVPQHSVLTLSCFAHFHTLPCELWLQICFYRVNSPMICNHLAYVTIWDSLQYFKNRIREPCTKNTKIMIVVNVLNTRAVAPLPKKKERIYASRSSHNLHKRVQKLTSFYFTFNIITELELKYCFTQHRKWGHMWTKYCTLHSHIWRKLWQQQSLSSPAQPIHVTKYFFP